MVAKFAHGFGQDLGRRAEEKDGQPRIGGGLRQRHKQVGTGSAIDRRVLVACQPRNRRAVGRYDIGVAIGFAKFLIAPEFHEVVEVHRKDCEWLACLGCSDS